MRRTAILLVVAILALGLPLVTSCTGNGVATTAAGETQATAEQGQTFTLSELSGYDGSEGQPAYVAVDGVVYDVSASSLWPDGTHAACNLGAMAGQDLSELITQAPARMRSLLEQMPVVGRLE